MALLQPANTFAETMEVCTDTTHQREQTPEERTTQDIRQSGPPTPFTGPICQNRGEVVPRLEQSYYWVSYPLLSGSLADCLCFWLCGSLSQQEGRIKSSQSLEEGISNSTTERQHFDWHKSSSYGGTCSVCAKPSSLSLHEDDASRGS